MKTATNKPLDKKRIVVIGAGFGGLNLVKNLREPNLEIVLIDQQNHHLFQSLLYQMATAGLSAPDIAQPIRSILSGREDVKILMAEVEAIDLDAQQISADGETFAYDYLVMALGGKTSYFGNDHWEEFAPGLKTLNDALHIRNKVLTAFEHAEAETEDRAKKQRLMTAVVVGGGPTGVEMAGAFAELFRHVFKKDFRHIDLSETHVVLVEGGDRILSAYAETLSRQAENQLKSLGVEVVTGDLVADIQPNQVALASGRVIDAETIIWAAGVEANPLTRTLDVPQDKGGRLKVEPDCSLPGYPAVFALGDMINLVDANGKPVPGVAQGAIQTANHVAKIIRREVRGESAPRPAFTYFDKGNMATIGRSRAIAEIMGVRISGFTAWILWLAIHLLFLVGLRNKVSVLVHWIYSYVTYRRGARLIWGEFKEKIARKSETQPVVTG